MINVNNRTLIWIMDVKIWFFINIIELQPRIEVPKYSKQTGADLENFSRGGGGGGGKKKKK